MASSCARAINSPGGNPRSAQRPLVASSCRRPARPRHPAADPRVSSDCATDRALWDHNWDSNAVLCETWQIPGANTSRRGGKPAEKAPFPAQRHHGHPCSALAVDHGMKRTANAPRLFHLGRRINSGERPNWHAGTALRRLEKQRRTFAQPLRLPRASAVLARSSTNELC